MLHSTVSSSLLDLISGIPIHGSKSRLSLFLWPEEDAGTSSRALTCCRTSARPSQLIRKTLPLIRPFQMIDLVLLCSLVSPCPLTNYYIFSSHLLQLQHPPHPTPHLSSTIGSPRLLVSPTSPEH